MERIKPSFDFDKKADVLYLTLNTGEPSYCEEVNDLLLVERGIYSNQITGFRFLDITHHKIKEIDGLLKRVFDKEKKLLYERAQIRCKRLPSALIKETYNRIKQFMPA